ncbi:MAG: hypothetical protein ACE147_06780 [Candidatus Methylomirabilales bacterium]
MANYEKGEVLAPADFLFEVCERFNVDFMWLMSGRGPQRRTDLMMSASAGRSEEDAERLLKRVQDLVFEHTFDRGPGRDKRLDPFSSALRISLSAFERSFSRHKDPLQFGDFLESLIKTTRELMGTLLDQLHAEEWYKLNPTRTTDGRIIPYEPRRRTPRGRPTKG